MCFSSINTNKHENFISWILQTIKDTSGKTCLDLCDEGRGGVNFKQSADMIRNKLKENVVWKRFIVSQMLKCKKCCTRSIEK